MMFIFAIMKKDLNIVWLKRDLRTIDHEPLFEAEKLKDETLKVNRNTL